MSVAERRTPWYNCPRAAIARGSVPTKATVVTFTNDAEVAILGDSDACKELVLADANVTLVRHPDATQPILHIYGNARRAASVASGATGSFGADDLASGFSLISEESVGFGAADDPIFDTTATEGAVTQSVIAFFNTSDVTAKFFKAAIGASRF